MKICDFFKKADIFLLILFLLIGIVSLIAADASSKDSDMVQITVDGELYGSYPLYQDEVISVDTEYGHNTVEIKDGAVSVTESNCPGHDCQHFGGISKAGQTIMCMPHHLIVAISGKSEFDVLSF